MKTTFLLLTFLLSVFTSNLVNTEEVPTITYRIVDTGVKQFYSDIGIIKEPKKGKSYHGQDASYTGNQPSYTDNGDGTITDNVTGLTWEKYMGDKIAFSESFKKAKASTLGGYTDWRVPTIKELYSLILFTGRVKGQQSFQLFIDTYFFIQPLGDESKGERAIDAQTWSSTEYVGEIMRGNKAVFGVNFVDGRIKGYPKVKPRTGSSNKMYFRMVRGSSNYGKNKFVDNGDGTISDLATGLMWQQSDDGELRDWKNSLKYAEGLNLAGHDDWRLPNAKELQSIVDYTRSPQTSKSASISDLFITSEFSGVNRKLAKYPYFWTSTTHLDGRNPYSHAVYFAFGEAKGEMRGKLMDVHGAGSQRSDPKSGEQNDYPKYFGPQGDIRFVYNASRCVRTIK